MGQGLGALPVHLATDPQPLLRRCEEAALRDKKKSVGSVGRPLGCPQWGSAATRFGGLDVGSSGTPLPAVLHPQILHPSSRHPGGPLAGRARCNTDGSPVIPAHGIGACAALRATSAPSQTFRRASGRCSSAANEKRPLRARPTCLPPAPPACAQRPLSSSCCPSPSPFAYCVPTPASLNALLPGMQLQSGQARGQGASCACACSSCCLLPLDLCWTLPWSAASLS